MPKEKFIRLAIISYIIAGLILIFGKIEWLPDFYNPRFMGAMSFISAFLIFLPRIFFRPLETEKQKSLSRFQTTIAISLLINGAGGLGLFRLYEAGFEYDKLVHFLVPLILTASFARFHSQWYSVPVKKSLFLAVIIILLGGVLWEGWEIFADWLFNTRTLGYYGNNITQDTIIDIVMNGVGILAGGIFVIAKKNKQPS